MFEYCAPTTMFSDPDSHSDENNTVKRTTAQERGKETTDPVERGGINNEANAAAGTIPA